MGGLLRRRGWVSWIWGVGGGVTRSVEGEEGRFE